MLKTLIDAGAGIDMFVEAGQEAVDRQKGFEYMLSIVKRQMTESEKIASTAHPRKVNDWTAGAI